MCKAKAKSRNPPPPPPPPTRIVKDVVNATAKDIAQPIGKSSGKVTVKAKGTVTVKASAQPKLRPKRRIAGKSSQLGSSTAARCAKRLSTRRGISNSERLQARNRDPGLHTQEATHAQVALPRRQDESDDHWRSEKIKLGQMQLVAGIRALVEVGPEEVVRAAENMSWRDRDLLKSASWGLPLLPQQELRVQTSDLHGQSRKYSSGVSTKETSEGWHREAERKDSMQEGWKKCQARAWHSGNPNNVTTGSSWHGKEVSWQWNKDTACSSWNSEQKKSWKWGSWTSWHDAAKSWSWKSETWNNGRQWNNEWRQTC